ncbi:MAG TPA: hypothetical protein VEU62_05725 [Bryobacterales bacterium]|nr:hypothetical protein [Bryobacterales bacterium]
MVRAVVWGLLAAGALTAQAEIAPAAGSGKVLLLPGDAAALETGEARRDFSCTVKPVEPALGFDLRLQAGYRAVIPWSELGGGGRLYVITRVTPVERPDRAVYLADRFLAPPVEPEAKGEVLAEGRFATGEGRYRVDWMARDAGGRICSAHWEFAARLPDRARGAAVPLDPDTVRTEPRELFAPEPPIGRAERRLPRVKLLLHWAPDRPGAVTLPREEASALVAMLRSLAREPRIQLAGLAAFDAQQRRVLFQQEGAAAVDLASLGRALEKHTGGLVDYRQLAGRDGGGNFLRSLAEPARGGEEPAPDAVIILGPKVAAGDGAGRIAKPNLPHTRVFFLDWTGDLPANPWKDPITALVGAAGGRVYQIRRPADWAAAWRGILERLAVGLD